jgi:bifunctional non-homologous end joining protein LigD
VPAAFGRSPAGPGWINEIKHDGFRILAHRRGRSVRLVTRNGHDLADHFPLAAAAIEALPIKSCVVDGEAIVCDDSGLAVFDLIRGHGSNARAILCAFDLIEVNGEDVRREPIADRKRRLVGLLRLPHDGIALNEVFADDGAVIYKHACALGCEGIVSKRLGSRYRAGRSAHWLKIKNPDAPAVRRLEEEDWPDEAPALPAALDLRRNGGLLHREGWYPPRTCIRLLRGRARPPHISGLTDEGRRTKRGGSLPILPSCRNSGWVARDHRKSRRI